MTETTKDQPAEQHAFEADVSRLLYMMVHSVYSDKDVFLRELISNAADACEKLRYEAIAAPDLLAGGEAVNAEVIFPRSAEVKFPNYADVDDAENCPFFGGLPRGLAGGA